MLKRVLAPLAIGGTVVGALALGAPAYAGTPAPTTPAPTTSAPTAAAHAGNGAARTWLKSHRKQLRAAGVVISAKTIGITSQALVADLKAGSSVAAVAGQHNVTVATVVGALDSAATARLNQAVGNHTITQAQAANVEAKLPAFLTKWVNHTF